MAADAGPLLYEHRRRVLMADTDAAGVIYYGCVFRWHESGMMRWLESAGHPISSLLGAGFAFPCVHSEADYTHPLRVDDALDVQLRTARVGRRSFELVSEARLEGTLAVRVRAAYVWANVAPAPGSRFQASELPGWLRGALEAEPAAR